jgi:hypothetical protein
MIDLQEVLDRWADWVADTSGLDRARIRQILAKCIDDRRARLPADQVAVDLKGPASFLLSQLIEASEYVGPERALEVCERTDLERLLTRYDFVKAWSEADPLVYTAPELAARMSELKNHLSRNWKYLLANGHPGVLPPEAIELLSSPWWYRFGSLYPIKIPVGYVEKPDVPGIVRLVAVWSRKPAARLLTQEDVHAMRAAGTSPMCAPDEICDYKSAPPIEGMSQEDADDLELLREKVLALEFGILGGLTESIQAGSADGIWERCLPLLTGSVVAREQRLSGHDIDFLLAMDQFYSGQDDSAASVPDTRLARVAGTFSSIIQLIGLCESGLPGQPGPRVRDVLGSAGLIEEGVLCPPRLSIRSQYEIAGTMAEVALDRAIELHRALAEVAHRSSQEFSQRVRTLLSHDIPVPVVTEMWVPRRVEKDARAVLDFFSETQVTHLQHFGKLMPLSLGSTDPRDEADAGAAENVFRREETGVWEIIYKGQRISLPDLKGLRYVLELLSRPNKPMAAVELSAAVHRHFLADETDASESETAERLSQVGSHKGGASWSEAIADDRTIQEIKSRIALLDEKTEAAKQALDYEGAQILDQERAKLEGYLKSASGLGRRKRRTGGSPKKAADSVAAAIDYAMEKIRNVHPELSEHLGACIKTGSLCSYEPRSDVRWRF